MSRKKRLSGKQKIYLVFLLLVMAFLPLKVILPIIHPGNEALYVAIKEGNIARIKTLLDAGADPNSTSRGFLWLEKEDGSDASYLYPPVVEAFDRDRLDIARLLLERGADPNWRAERSGITPLMIAARDKKLEALKMLLEKGANVDQKDHKGSTALLNAIGSGEAETVRTLLAHGADVDVVTGDGGTALRYGKDHAARWPHSKEVPEWWMQRSGSPDVADLLKRAGAKQ